MRLENLFTTKETAEILGMNPMTLNRYIRKGRIFAYRLNLGGERVRYVIPESAIKAFNS